MQIFTLLWYFWTVATANALVQASVAGCIIKWYFRPQKNVSNCFDLIPEKRKIFYLSDFLGNFAGKYWLCCMWSNFMSRQLDIDANRRANTPKFSQS